VWAHPEERGGWIQRELPDEGDPARSNAQFKYLLSKGQMGLDVIGLSCRLREYLHYLDPPMAALREHGLEPPVVVGGSVVTAAAAQAIRAKGVAAAFGPTAEAAKIVATIERLVRSAPE
jgi:methylmalonyl-CoA mutase cobalamin-binding subunit